MYTHGGMNDKSLLASSNLTKPIQIMMMTIVSVPKNAFLQLLLYVSLNVFTYIKKDTYPKKTFVKLQSKNYYTEHNSLETFIILPPGTCQSWRQRFMLVFHHLYSQHFNSDLHKEMLVEYINLVFLINQLFFIEKVRQTYI